MKNIKELFDALLMGESLITETSDSDDEIIYIRDDTLYGISDLISLTPEFWKIQENKQWYNFIPKSGVLCWVWGLELNNPFSRLAFIVKYNAENTKYFVDNSSVKWKHAELFNKDSANSQIKLIEKIEKQVKNE